MPHFKFVICLIILAIFSGAEAADSKAELLDATALPLGDGKISPGPKQGYVYPCMTHFRGGGAQHSGEWLGWDSWDETRKIHVQGDVPWPNAQFNILTVNDVRQIVGNGLPLAHNTGIFPVERTDPAFQIDRNPNQIQAQHLTLNLPLKPEVVADASCLPMGMIGITTGGVTIFNALDDAGRDAVAHEVQDQCNGHPQKQGLYHYHGPSPCHAAEAENNALIGYALDGFGIYSNLDENGKTLTNADLDECHGRTSRIHWDGQEVTMYHYVLTREYPYTLGCFRGHPVSGHALPQEGGYSAKGGPANNRPRQPPQEAVAACENSPPGAECGFVSPRGDNISGSCRSPNGQIVCVPDRLPGR